MRPAAEEANAFRRDVVRQNFRENVRYKTLRSGASVFRRETNVDAERSEIVDATQTLRRPRAENERQFRSVRRVFFRRFKLFFNKEIERRVPDAARDQNEASRRVAFKRDVPTVAERAPKTNRVARAKRRQSRRSLADDRVNDFDPTRSLVGVVNCERSSEKRIVAGDKTKHNKLAGRDAGRELRRFDRDFPSRFGDLPVFERRPDAGPNVFTLSNTIVRHAELLALLSVASAPLRGVVGG